MTAPKHTPGKWLAVQDGDGYWLVVMAEPDPNASLFLRDVVGSEGLYRLDGSDEANAHLIAAAPELYGQHEADLIDLELLRGDIVRGATSSVLMIRIDDMIRRKNAALAKARGEANG